MKRQRTFNMMARPEWMNGFGSMHGSEYIKIMDELAGVTADWYDPKPYVTAGIHDVRIIEPVFARDVLRGEGLVVLTKRHAVVVKTQLYVRHRLGLEEKLAAQGIYVMVPRKDAAMSREVEPFIPETEEEKIFQEKLLAAMTAFKDLI